MIKPKCKMCKAELKRFGAVLLSPPVSKDIVYKYHLCIVCYNKLRAWMDNKER